MKKVIITVSFLGLLAIGLLFGKNLFIQKESNFDSKSNSNVNISTTNNISSSSETEKPKYRAGLIIPTMPKDTFEFLAGRTLWDSRYEQYRIYFDKNGTGKLQFFSNAFENKIGDIKDFKWTIDSRVLCFDFSDNRIKKRCEAYSLQYNKRGIPLLTDSFVIRDPIYGETSIDFNRQFKGNQLLKPQYAQEAIKTMGEMKMLQQRMYNGVFDYDNPGKFDKDKLQYGMDKYLQALVDRVHIAPITYLHFRKDGSYSQILTGHYQQFNGDHKAISDTMLHGHWWIVDNKYHCYGRGYKPWDKQSRGAFCSTTFPADWMLESFDGFVTHSTHDFTIKHPIENFINLEDFSTPELFSKIE